MNFIISVKLWVVIYLVVTSQSMKNNVAYNKYDKPKAPDTAARKNLYRFRTSKHGEETPKDIVGPLSSSIANVEIKGTNQRNSRH